MALEEISEAWENKFLLAYSYKLCVLGRVWQMQLSCIIGNIQWFWSLSHTRDKNISASAASIFLSFLSLPALWKCNTLLLECSLNTDRDPCINVYVRRLLLKRWCSFDSCSMTKLSQCQQIPWKVQSQSCFSLSTFWLPVCGSQPQAHWLLPKM